MEYVKKDRKGTLWMETKSKVIYKGSCHHKTNPSDPNDKGVDKYYSILKTEFANGEPKYELVQSVGLIYLKDGNASNHAPDFGGPVTIDLGNGTTASQKFGGWINKNAETGATTVGIGFIDSIKKDESDSPFPSDGVDVDDGMPF